MNDTVPVADQMPALTMARITVLDVQHVKGSKMFALATVEIDIDGVVILVHGIQALRCEPAGTRIELPKYRDAGGVWRTSVTLPEEIKAPIGDAVLEALLTRGIASPRF